MSRKHRFCSYCGSGLLAVGSDGPRRCTRCGELNHTGPDLLVLVHVFYRNRLLLLKRGVQPYRETWAPPGGFVESGESVEAAAVRELREEVGVELAATQLAAHAVVSVPRMNQVYHLFVAHLKSPVRAVAVLPESLEVGWFTWDELGSLNVWEPGASLEMNLLFDAVGCRRVEFYQQVQ